MTRPTFTVTFRALPGVDGISALRRLLKYAKRQLGLRCTDIREYPNGEPPRRVGCDLDSAAGESKMSIGKRMTSTDFMPVVKYDARNGRVFTETRVLTERGWEPTQSDVSDVLKSYGAIFDIENGERGWIKFVKGGAPDMVMVPFGDDPGEAPSLDHREGIRLVAKFPKDEPREFLSTALAVWTAVDSLHSVFEKQRKDNAGKVPVIKLANVTETKTKSGSSFVPGFVLDRWVPRPADLPNTPIVKKSSPSSRRGDDREIDRNMDRDIPM